MANEVICTSGIDTISLSRWDSPANGNISGIRRSKFFDPKVDKIDLQGHKIEDLTVVNSSIGVLIHYIPQKWQIKLADNYTGILDFSYKEIVGTIPEGGSISRNYNDIIFWGSRPYSEGPERVHTFNSPDGSAEDFVFLLSNSRAEQFKTWDSDKIIFLGAKQKKTASPQDGDEDAYPIAAPQNSKSRTQIRSLTSIHPLTP